ncbi:hypothetical protein NIES21_39490 [Anabaenopsis circularis NIES-21]|uniref:Uncharacterized protein n=1 Tax=Anabaenopsis circularis NIES-21 TaxID=1085406 RepID=A0A1Z4GL83_9CYAN|nr:hypothetical protein NIES21_39490 [Anabaenopsis circularis NIES-21]
MLGQLESLNARKSLTIPSAFWRQRIGRAMPDLFAQRLRLGEATVVLLLFNLMSFVKK